MSLISVPHPQHLFIINFMIKSELYSRYIIIYQLFHLKTKKMYDFFFSSSVFSCPSIALPPKGDRFKVALPYGGCSVTCKYFILRIS